MKKTFQISLAKSLFTIEEDAYMKLDEYLNSVRHHFRNTEGREEIIQDIEARIAEQFMEASAIVTIEEVEKVIAAMGTVDEFGDDDGKEELVSRLPRKRKLYRNPDDSVIGGVCSGLAAYFGIETLIVRLIFVALLFANGIGVMVYIVLLIAMPAAKTASQKLEMQGSDVTLESLSEASRQTSGNDTILMRMAEVIKPIIRIGFGVAFLLMSAAILGAMIFGLPHIVTLPFSQYVDFPISDMVSLPHFYGAVAAVYLAVIIPLVIIILLSVGLIRKKNILSKSFAYWAVGVWIVSSLIGTIAVASINVAYRDYRLNNPDFETVTRTISLEGEIKSLRVAQGQKVNIVQSSEQGLTLTGLRKNVDYYQADLSNNTLTIAPTSTMKACWFFCERGAAQYVLTVPSLENIQVENGSRVSTEQWNGAGLEVDLKNGSRADMRLNVPTLRIQAQYGSRVDVQGTASGATLESSYGASIDASELSVNNADVTATFGAHIETQIQDMLNATASEGGSIEYIGNPKVSKNEERGGRVHAK